MLDIIKGFLSPLDEVKLSQIALAVILGLLGTILGAVVGLSGLLTATAVVFILLDIIVALVDKDYKRLLSKGVGYLFVTLITVGAAQYLTLSANAVFVSIVAFSFTEIIGSVTSIFKKIKL